MVGYTHGRTHYSRSTFAPTGHINGREIIVGTDTGHKLVKLFFHVDLDFFEGDQSIGFKQ